MSAGTYVSDVTAQALGHWPVILAGLPIDVPAGKKHGPCPVCGGTDRFRFDDLEGRGTWICSHCDKRAGDGLDLVARVLNKSLKEAAALVAPLVGMTGASLDPVERERLHQQGKARAAAEQQKDEQQRRKAVVRAADIMRDTTQGNPAYLAGKGLGHVLAAITSTGPINVARIQFPAGSLVVPLYIEAGDLVNVQMIDADGNKRYLPSGQKAGAFHCIDGDDLIAIVEGYATGLSVWQAAGATVYCAMDCGNLLAVAEIAHRQHPDAEILICGDNDANTKGNPGKINAEQAADAVGGKVVLPPVAGDWNDYHQANGLEEMIDAMISAKEQSQEASQKEDLSLASNVVSLRPVAVGVSTQDLDPETLAKMSADRVARLFADDLGIAAVCRESGIVYKYEAGVWLPVSDARLSPMLAAMYSRVGSPYTAKKLNGIVETMKVGLPEMGQPSVGLIGFANGIYDLKAGRFLGHSPEYYLPSHNGIMYGEPVPGETLEQNAPSFYRWLYHAAKGDTDKMKRINAALFMVLANRYDWQLFLEVTGEGGSGKSVMANLCELLVGKENVGSTSMEAMRGAFGLENVWDKRLILLPDQSQYIGDGALLKAVTGGDEVAINRKGKAMFGAKIRAVVIATNNEPMKMTERNGGMARRRVIFAFNNVVADADKDPQIGEKIAAELPVIIRHLLTQFADPELAKGLLLEQRDGAEALAVKQEADPVLDLCTMLVFLDRPEGLFMGGGAAIKRESRRFLYHLYLDYMEHQGNGRPLGVRAFAKAVKQAAKEIKGEYLTRLIKGVTQTNVAITEAAEAFMPKAVMVDEE